MTKVELNLIKRATIKVIRFVVHDEKIRRTIEKHLKELYVELEDDLEDAQNSN